MAVLAALFPGDHPYHWSTIGEIADLHAARIDEVREFFSTYYHPGNASLSVAGDIDSSEALDLVRAHFEDLPAGPPGKRTVRGARRRSWRAGPRTLAPALDRVTTPAVAPQLTACLPLSRLMPRDLPASPTRRSSDLYLVQPSPTATAATRAATALGTRGVSTAMSASWASAPPATSARCMA